MYIHQRKDWPHFYWEEKKISLLLIELRHQQGLLVGAMGSIGFRVREEAILSNLTQEVIKTSEIEGEILDPSSVRSSVARRLGIESGALTQEDERVKGIVEMTLDATQNFHRPLTKTRLFGWHKQLFPNGRSGFSKIRVGRWRTGPVEVISGRPGKEKVHFEGPAADRVFLEMEHFLNWLNREERCDFVLKGALAHLWFVTIHPFEDGNGRIGRAIGDLFLARSEGSALRFYSLSAQIQAERKDYYSILEKTQKGSLDITPWIEWFLGCLSRALKHALSILENVQYKEQVWRKLADIPLNERQRKVIRRLLEDFKGNLTSSKWAKIAKCSQDTAHRDISDLVRKGVLVKESRGGRSTSYSLNYEPGP
jgi:Fic family protein